jgi:hypothetical protein
VINAAAIGLVELIVSKKNYKLQGRPHRLVAESKVVRNDKASDGREIWHITSDGQHRTIITTSTTASVMESAISLFAPALRRLADR